MIFPFRQIRSGWRTLKYRRMRANKQLPPCDWWDFKYDLADFIKQGLTGLLYKGVTNWESPHHQKEKEELEFVLKWATEFPYYESAIVVTDEQDSLLINRENLSDADYMVITLDEAKAFAKKTEKAMKLLGKNFSTLWD